MEDEETSVIQTPGKKRIPKSCSACRHSKVRCDELRPACTRCKHLKKQCIYVEKPKSAQELEIQELKDEIIRLNRYIPPHLRRDRSVAYRDSETHGQTDRGTVTEARARRRLLSQAPTIL